MYRLLGEFSSRNRWQIIAGWLLATVALRLLAPDWSAVALDGDFDQLPATTPTARAVRLNAAAFPNDATKSQLVLVFAREGEALTPDDRQFVKTTAKLLEELPGLPLVDEVWTEETPVIGPMLKSPAGHAQRVVARLTNDVTAVDNIRVLDDVERLVSQQRAEAPPGLQVGVTGSAAVGGDILAAAAKSLRRTDRATILLVVLTLALIYRSLWLVLVPLISIGTAVVASLSLLSILAGLSHAHPEWWLSLRVFTTTRIFVVVLLFGAGTDFCLFLLSRFRESRSSGLDHHAAIVDAVARVGGAVVASAATTIVGLAMMGFADFGKFTYSGPAIAISLSVALVVSLTMTPALLATPLGGRLKLPANDVGPRRWDRQWHAVAEMVVARPRLLLALSLALATPLALHGSRVSVTYDIFSELAPETTSQVGTRLLGKHFPPGENGPLTVLAKVPRGGLLESEGRYQIAELHKLLHETPGVDKVRSLYRPLGDAPGAVHFSMQGVTELVAANSPLAKEAFVSSLSGEDAEATRLVVVLKDEPFSADAVATTARIEQALQQIARDKSSDWHGATFELMGTSSGIRDLEQVTQADRARIQVLVATAVFLVILALLRRPLVCLYLIATVILSYLTTLGAVDLLFRAIDGPAYPGLDWKVPLFLFVILVAVGQDYNIYLVTRVVEEQKRLGPIAGLKHALVQTGGIITSCGVIMAITFASLMVSDLRGMVELGTALSLGILLDTFVVRTILVPAFLAMLAKRGRMLTPRSAR